jgi:hypothetical protein
MTSTEVREGSPRDAEKPRSRLNRDLFPATPSNDECRGGRVFCGLDVRASQGVGKHGVVVITKGLFESTALLVLTHVDPQLAINLLMAGKRFAMTPESSWIQRFP